MSKHIIIAWTCDLCNWLTISDSRESHKMDYCRCGKTSMDLELEYARFTGSPRTVAEYKVGKDGEHWRGIIND